MHNLWINTALITALMAPSALYAETVHYVISPQVKRQTVLGFGVEIQSDSIGSGNNGLPKQALGIPNDLDPAERDRLATEMLRGFRYLRLAGGLYWRGLDTEQRQLLPRWPEQLIQLKQLMDKARIEGLSFEYWSPAPYWKANRNYLGVGKDDPYNTLRPFGPNFATDADYHGDRERFFSDFGQAVVRDIQTLKQAGLQVSMFGLQNEPHVSNDQYPSNKYYSSPDYIAAFKSVSHRVRQLDPHILIMADTGYKFPSYIAPGMGDPGVASLVDAYVVHTIGDDASTVRAVDAQIKALPVQRPWFQNEYEYLTGGATSDRTLNTVQHIISSFQDAGNPTWFWLHALKPAGNAEASGYALGFWNSRLAPAKPADPDAYARWDKGPAVSGVPKAWQSWEMVYLKGRDPAQPARGHTFLIDKPARIHLLVDGTIPLGWSLSGVTMNWQDGKGRVHTDRVAEKTFPAGEVEIPANVGGAPHAAFVEPTDGTVEVMIGVNMPIYVRSQTRRILELTKDLAPGHWTFNPLNWNAVGSFVRHMPWNSVVIDANSTDASDATRLLVFQKPDGKRTIVVANRKTEPVTFDVSTGLAGSRWLATRYTPQKGRHDMAEAPSEQTSGSRLRPTVPAMSWEFWEEQ